MARFEPRAGLDVEIANRFGRPKIDRVLDMLRDESQRRAPVTRVWITMRDERVRWSHFETDTQVVPDNLRFKLPKPDGTGFDLARRPRDPTLPAAQRFNCRCDDPTVPHLLRESIHKGDVRVVGTLVSGSVETRFPRAAESEFGTSGDEPAHYMTNALREVAARLQAGHAR
jgi:hypothetical protein